MNEFDGEIEKETQLRDPVCNSELPGFASTNSDGLTKRELIAAMCMQGILANPSLTRVITNSDSSFTIIGTTRAGAVKVAAAHADALLRELEKPTNEPIEAD